MSILYISYNGVLEPLANSQIIPYLRELCKEGFKFILLSFEKNVLFSSEKKVEICQFKDKLAKMNIDWYWLSYHKRPVLLATVFDIFCGIVYSFCLIVCKRVKVIHARSYIPAIIAYILSKIFRIKFIFDMRGMAVDEYVDGGLVKGNSFVYKMVKTIEKTLLLSADSIVVLTDRIKSVIKNMYYLKHKKNLNIEVIPCCVDLAKFSYFSKKQNDLVKQLKVEEKFTFVYAGSIGTWHASEEMFNFFGSVKKKIHNAHFLIFTHSDANLVNNIITKERLNSSDFTILKIPPEVIENYISLGDVGVIFYKPTFSRLATSPVKLAEYLACGLPVIINRGVGDTQRLIESNKVGIVIDGFSESDNNTAIDNLLELMKEGQSLRMRCGQAAQRFLSLEDGVKRYQKIYQALAQE